MYLVQLQPPQQYLVPGGVVYINIDINIVGASNGSTREPMTVRPRTTHACIGGMIRYLHVLFVPGTPRNALSRYQVPGTWYQVSYTRYVVLVSYHRWCPNGTADVPVACWVYGSACCVAGLKPTHTEPRCMYAARSRVRQTKEHDTASTPSRSR